MNFESSAAQEVLARQNFQIPVVFYFLIICWWLAIFVNRYITYVPVRTSRQFFTQVGRGSRKQQQSSIQRSDLPPSCCCHCLWSGKSHRFHFCFNSLFKICISFLLLLLFSLQTEWASLNTERILLQCNLLDNPCVVVIVNDLQITQNVFEFSLQYKRPL